MRWLVRTVKKTRKGAVTHSDELFTGDALTIGRGAGQGVFLPSLKVALEHARIRQVRGSRFRIESLTAAGVRVDGKIQQAAAATIGTRIEIGDHVIEPMRPPDGYDAAVKVVELEGASEAESHVSRRHTSSLRDTWLSKRGPAWVLFLLFIAIGLIVPVAGYFMPGLQETLRGAPVLPSDRQWEAGTLQNAHHFFGQDCNACHTQAFKRVRDEACISCHARTPVHADPEFFDIEALTETPCTVCHRDHNGPEALISAREALCTSCHEDLSETTDGTTILANVTSFSDDHPQFKVELAGWDMAGNYTPRRESLGSTTLLEDSNLTFPHDKHLNPEGLNAPAGKRVLDCGDCHEAERGGGKMKPVKYETMCQECHALGFDPTAPNRQVPHGDAGEVLFMLEEYYTNKALRGGVTEATAPPVVRRRRPGDRVSREERMQIVAWANEQSQRVGQSLFEGQACGVCHSVQRVDTEDGISWRVDPVRVAGIWYASALFTHGSHTTMECESCHQAGESSTSNDVLIPGLENCQQCHGGEDVPGKVPSPCIDCHRYHDHPQTMMVGLKLR